MPNMNENNEHIEIEEKKEPLTSPSEETLQATSPAMEAPVAQAPAEDALKQETSTEDTPAAEAPATEVPAAEAPTTEAPAEEAPAEEAPAAAAPAQEKSRPYYERYAKQTKSADEVEEEARGKRIGRVRNAILATVLAVSLLTVALFGGFALGRVSAPILPSGTTTQNQGGGSGGSGTGSQPPIDRGDLVLNVIERVEGVPAPGSVPGVVAAVKDSVVDISLTQTQIDPYSGEVVSVIYGSGILISSGNVKGLILTCHHVIEGADEGGITVTLSDGREFSGSQVEVLGSDLWSDVALLRIREENGNAPENLTYATLATSGKPNDYSYMSLGETAIVIGNPLGSFSGSVTVGVVSAISRDVSVEGLPMTLFQIDAATNPGNSGGAVFNAAGELIGLFNAGINDVEGISFAVPSADVIPLIGEIYTQGYVSNRPFLGLYFTAGSGYYVVSEYLYNDELTDGNTIQMGDYLTHIDGEKITSTNVIRSVLAKKEVGDFVTLTLVRVSGRSQKTFEVWVRVHENIP